MSHTLPPWTSKYKMATLFGNLDHAELAARLGALSKFDRSGQVIWFDDFEGSILKWLTAVNSANTTISLNAARPLQGSKCMKFFTGDEAGNWGRATYYLFYPVLSKIGFEISSTYHAYIDRLLWKIILYTGSTVNYAQIEWENSSNKLYYKDKTDDANLFPSGTVTELGETVDLNMSVYGYFTAKLVVDFSTGKYVRFILNNTTYDMSSLYYFTEAETATPPQMRVRVAVDGGDTAGAREATVYYDNAIVTWNED